MMRQGNTGSEILQILDVIVADFNQQSEDSNQSLMVTTPTQYWLTLIEGMLDITGIPFLMLDVYTDMW